MFHCHNDDKQMNVACICVDIDMSSRVNLGSVTRGNKDKHCVAQHVGCTDSHAVLGSVTRVTGSKHCVAQQVVCTNSRVACGSVTRTTKNNVNSNHVSLHEKLVFGAWAFDPGRARFDFSRLGHVCQEVVMSLEQ